MYSFTEFWNFMPNSRNGGACVRSAERPARPAAVNLVPRSSCIKPQPNTTPLWNQLVHELDLMAQNGIGRKFLTFIEQHMYEKDLCWKNTDGDWLPERMSTEEKMEKLLEVASEKRQHTLEKIARDSAERPISDDSYEIGEEDMRKMLQRGCFKQCVITPNNLAVNKLLLYMYM